jgi:tetrathionate reductase subunit B
MHTPTSPPETPLPGKRGFLKGLLGLGAAATVIPIHADAAPGLNGQPPRRPGMAAGH